MRPTKTRREILREGAAVAALLGTGSAWSTQGHSGAREKMTESAHGSDVTPRFEFHFGESYVVGGHKSDHQQDPATDGNYIAIRFSKRDMTQLIPVKYDVHSVMQDPSNRLSIVAVSKEKKQSTFIPNILEPSQQIVVESGKDLMFSGHGVFSPDGKVAVFSETNDRTDAGVLTIRDGKTFRMIHQMTSHGVYPHEMAFRENGRVLAVANGGLHFANSNFSLIEFESGKLIEQHSPPKPGPGCRHFVTNQHGDFVLGSWNRYDDRDQLGTHRFSAEILAGSIGKPSTLKALNPSSGNFNFQLTDLVMQYLSVGFHAKTNSAVLTASNVNAVLVVDMSSHAIKQRIPLSRPCGVAPSEDEDVMIVSNSHGKLSYLDMNQLEWRTEIEMTDTKFTGSHITQMLPHFKRGLGQ